jgi:hypothetical protein
VYPQSDLKGQHAFSRLLPAKKKKANIQEEQLHLLRQILAELQTLNANLSAVKPSPQPAEASPSYDDDSDDELEEYE